MRARLHDIAASVEEPSDVVVLSATGMAIRLHRALPLATRHTFTIEIDGEAFDVDGIVRNTRSAGEGMEEVGVEFVDLTPDQASRVESFVLSRSTRKP